MCYWQELWSKVRRPRSQLQSAAHLVASLWQVSSSLDVPVCGLWALSGPNELLFHLVLLPCAYCLLDQLNLILGRLEASQFVPLSPGSQSVFGTAARAPHGNLFDANFQPRYQTY